MLSRRLLRIKVVKALYSHLKSESDSLLITQKNLLFSVDKTYELYHLMLSLVADVRNYAINKIEIGKNKRLPTAEELSPNMKFARNRVVNQIENTSALGDYLQIHSLGWGNYPGIIKKIYNNMCSKEYYTAYMSSTTDSYKEDKEFVLNFFLNEIEDFDDIDNVIEEQSIYWADDILYVLGSVIRTVTNLRENLTEVKLPKQFKDEDDKVFAKEVLTRALVGYDEYMVYIDKNTDNWELERIAYMDRIIMLAAVAELLSCPTIPVKVTLDEYIEIAKYYSTSISGSFINGVTDRIVSQLKKEGKISKEGRGLLEKMK